MNEIVLGISAYYHDSAAAILVNGEIIAAAHEERFTRKKQDESFPVNAIKYVLEEAGITCEEVTAIAFYDKPYIKFERLLETYYAMTPKGLISFLSSMPVWIKEKLFMKKILKDEFKKLGARKNVQVLFPEHHLSHAASAFYPSRFEDAAILTIDGVGEWATTTIGHGNKNQIKIIKELSFPHSLGLLYSSFTYYIGFRVNSGEYKLMGLAPYGNQDSPQTHEFISKIKSELVDIREDGSILLNMDYFSFATELRLCNNKKWKELFNVPRREEETEMTQDYMNLALAIQHVTEEIVLKLAVTARKLTQSKNLVMAGGVALNCVVNGKLIKEGIFENIWVQPASGDAGGALGAAQAAWYIGQGKQRIVTGSNDMMKGSYLGPEYGNKDIMKVCRKYNSKYEFIEDFDELASEVALHISNGKIIGWFQGRMEFGPRALGNRSILGDPRNPEMQKKMNLKIKYREGFRPFAPSVLEEDIEDFFELDQPSPYMLLVAPVKAGRRKKMPSDYQNLDLYKRLYHLRSDIPSVTHIDYSARIQSVGKENNSKYWTLINEFKKITGYGVLVNSSFNVRGEPIVCSPDDAYRCFMRTELDFLVIGNFLFSKKDQVQVVNDKIWKEEFVLD
jgi:carbamoyltransferase